jgi:hypothetical protein
MKVVRESIQYVSFAIVVKLSGTVFDAILYFHLQITRRKLESNEKPMALELLRYAESS